MQIHKIGRFRVCIRCKDDNGEDILVYDPKQFIHKCPSDLIGFCVMWCGKWVDLDDYGNCSIDSSHVITERKPKYEIKETIAKLTPIGTVCHDDPYYSPEEAKRKQETVDKWYERIFGRPTGTADWNDKANELLFLSYERRK